MGEDARVLRRPENGDGAPVGQAGRHPGGRGGGNGSLGVRGPAARKGSGRGAAAGAGGRLVNGAERRVAREWKTLQAMIRIRCRNVHGGGTPLCASCEELRLYAERRLEKCPFAEEKPTCVKCPVHCYEATMRERVREVMRHAGPRMLLRHPVLALLHFRDERRPLSEKAQKVAEKLRKPG
ncbi:MAG: nitrous oxide-stimulated promoter family protein [Holophagales bacterium]|nr:nitrous oxide-stimulated promoter family protein [Holophagales bacterium]